MIDQIAGTTRAWESGQLGQDDSYACVADIDSAELDAALGLKLITLRLDQTLIDDLAILSVLHGQKGCQPLIRKVLADYVRSEKEQQKAQS